MSVIRDSPSGWLSFGRPEESWVMPTATSRQLCLKRIALSVEGEKVVSHGTGELVTLPADTVIFFNRIEGGCRVWPAGGTWQFCDHTDPQVPMSMAFRMRFTIRSCAHNVRISLSAAGPGRPAKALWVWRARMPNGGAEGDADVSG